MSTAQASPWPVPVQALGPSNVATVVFRYRAAFHLAVIVKASFQWVQAARCQSIAPEVIARGERAWEGEGARSPETVADLAPFLPRAEVRVTGHAYGPPGVMVPASSVRLGVFRDVALIEKTIHVYGDRRTAREGPRPFQRMPLRYELAYGGPGTDNPAGVGAAPGMTPNLMSPLDPQQPAAFAAIARAWPPRARRAKQIAGLDAPIYDLPDDFDFTYFQAAAEDQQVEALGGDEWLLLDGMHPSAPRLSCQLPGARAEALVWAETGPSAGMRWSPPLALDTVLVDADKHRVDLVWRGSFTLPGGDAIVSDLRAAAGVDVGQAIVFPDVDAALLARSRLAAPASPSVEETYPGAEPSVGRQQTRASMRAVASDLPFGPSSSAKAQGSQQPPPPSLHPLPWDRPASSAPPPRARMSSATGVQSVSCDGETPLPDETTPQPALPFERMPLDALGASAAAFTSSRDDAEATRAALATGSTAPPPPPEGTAPVPIPRPPLVPVVVPPPAVGSGPLGGGWSLRYDQQRTAPQLDPVAASPPPFVPPLPPPPARVAFPPISSEREVSVPDASLRAGTLLGQPDLDEGSSEHTDVRGPDREATVLELESTETTAPAGLDAARAVHAPLASAYAPPLQPPPLAATPRAPQLLPAQAAPAGPLDELGRLRLRLAAGEDLAGEDLARQDLSGFDFSGASLARVNLTGAMLRGCRFVRAKLADAKLVGADLEGADLTAADLTRADLSRAKLGSATLRDAQITQTTLVGVEAESADFGGAKGARANLSRARLKGASFAGADLPSADFTGALLTGADLRGAQLADAVLDDAHADDACFEDARLVRVRGHGANLARARMARVVASGSGWDRATFDGADATGCDLSDAALLRASLAGAVFRDADLRGAKLANAAGEDVDFGSARLDGADLRQARLDGAKLDGATLVKVVATKVSLERATLIGAELRSGNFRGAKLKGADLQSASLRDADLRDADLENARLDGSDCNGARMQGANLDGATGAER